MIYEVVKATALYMGLTFSVAGILAFSFIAVLYSYKFMEEGYRLGYLALGILFWVMFFVMGGVGIICLNAL